MIETAVVASRFVQFSGGAVLFGTSLFLLYALPLSGPGSAPALGWPRRLLTWAALSLLVAAVAGLVAQTAMMAGSLQEGLDPAALGYVIGETSLGRAALIRATAAAAALLVLISGKPGTGMWGLCAALGADVCASFAWMGHGAATEGPGATVHLAADVLHSLAAAAWIGALGGFLALLLRKSPTALDRHVLQRALHRFSGIGSALVAAIVATGLVNSWFLVGPSRLGGLASTPYGLILLAKLALFTLMLALAAANRFRLTPRLREGIGAGAPAPAMADLKRSLLLETTAAFGVLALVAWLGTLAPISAQ